jgi:hypothetical protein
MLKRLLLAVMFVAAAWRHPRPGEKKGDIIDFEHLRSPRNQ